jgi:hypothetical protein
MDTDTPDNEIVLWHGVADDGEHTHCCDVCAAKLDDVHTIIKELKGLEATLLPVLEGMQKNPMLKMFFKK